MWLLRDVIRVTWECMIVFLIRGHSILLLLMMDKLIKSLPVQMVDMYFQLDLMVLYLYSRLVIYHKKVIYCLILFINLYYFIIYYYISLYITFYNTIFIIKSRYIITSHSKIIYNYIYLLNIIRKCDSNFKYY